MPMYDAEDIVELKNRKKRRKRQIKFLVFLLIAAICAGLYYYRDSWLPKLKGIGKQYKTIVNDGELAKGNFPIEINGGSEYRLSYSDDKLFLLSDAYLYYYNTDGGQLKKRQHAYTNAVVTVADGTALVYESGGNELRVEDEDTIYYTKHFDDTIMFACLSAERYTAVVTSSANYACELYVYNDDGDIIYERNCVERINDISFTGESSGCVLSYIGAENGELGTSVQKITFSSKKEKWTSPTINTLGLETSSADGGAFVLGYDACAYVDKNGKISSFYEYDGELAGGESRGGNAAVIMNDDDMRNYTLALFDGAETPVTVSFDEPLKHVAIYDGLAYVMSQSEIRTYDFSGKLRATAEITDSYEEFRRSGDYIFLMSYNRIDRID